MTIIVYPRLSALLRAKGLNVAELERQIRRRFGVSVDPKSLYRLTYDEPVQRADLEIAGAAAAVLGVGLDDLFEVKAIPAKESEELEIDLSPEESRRLAELFERQAHETLSGAECEELDALVAEYGRRLHERRVRELAEQRSIPVEQARREAATQFDEALAWWRGFEKDPEGRRAIVARVGGHRARAAE